MVDTTFANLSDGLQLLSLFDQAFAQCAQVNPPTIVTAAGIYTVSATNYSDVLIHKTVPAATFVELPPAANRNNQPVSIVDGAGNASTYNITILPSGAETIVGLADLVISTDFGAYTLYPYPTGGWYLK